MKWDYNLIEAVTMYSKVKYVKLAGLIGFGISERLPVFVPAARIDNVSIRSIHFLFPLNHPSISSRALASVHYKRVVATIANFKAQ